MGGWVGGSGCGCGWVDEWVGVRTCTRGHGCACVYDLLQAVREYEATEEKIKHLDQLVCVTYIMSNRYVCIIKPEGERFMMQYVPY